MWQAALCVSYENRILALVEIIPLQNETEIRKPSTPRILI